jgi:hypothetical protein
MQKYIYLCQKCHDVYYDPTDCWRCHIPTIKIPVSSKCICMKCKKEYDSSSEYCPSCYCPTIRAPITSGDKFFCWKDELDELLQKQKTAESPKTTPN